MPGAENSGGTPVGTAEVTPGYILMTDFRNKLSFLRKDWIRKARTQKQLHTNYGTSSMGAKCPQYAWLCVWGGGAGREFEPWKHRGKGQGLLFAKIIDASPL